jgi:anti-anti-sigma factor
VTAGEFDRTRIFPGGLLVAISEQGTTTTLAVRGEWDLAQQQVVECAIDSVLGDWPECLVLDLSRLGFADSTAVSSVLELQQRAVRQDVRLVIVPGPPSVHACSRSLG